jgi:hypothetical protein
MKKQKKFAVMKIDRQATRKLGQHESRLTSYAAAVGAFLAGGAAVNADVIFYDLSGAPQSTTSNGSVYFNFETGAVGPTAPVTPASGTFHLHQSTVPTARSSATRHAAVVFGLPAGNGAASIAVSNGNPPSAQDLASHAPIGNSRRFQTHGTLYANSESIGNGRWHPGQDTGYLGVTFKGANGVHYGWALVTLNNDVSTTLRGFAYETVANKSIQAGQIPLLLTKAVSRKTQGAADFDISLPLTGSPGVECRTGGAGNNHTLVFTFTTNIVSGNASVTNGAVATPGTLTFSGTTMILPLSGVSDDQLIEITLSNVTDNFGQILPNSVVKIWVAFADVTGDLAVNASDVSLTKAKSGQALNQTNFREDVTVNGSINSSDVSAVKSESGLGPIPSRKLKGFETQIAPR